MKKSVFFICMLLSFVFLLSGCHTETTESTKPPVTTAPEHTHAWQDVSGEHARICTVCNEKQLKSEACQFVREHCDDYGECSICHAVSPPEEHDWGPERTVEDCWSFTVTKTCSKCQLENWMHGDLAWPDHTWKEETEDGKTTFSCTRCKESYALASEIATFSYAKVLEEHKIGDPGVKQENFLYSTDNEIASVTDAITMAKYHLTIEYDTIAVSFDETSGVWCVDFYTMNMPGGGQSIYVNPSDSTCYIVYGE